MVLSIKIQNAMQKYGICWVGGQGKLCHKFPNYGISIKKNLHIGITGKMNSFKTISVKKNPILWRSKMA
jgi:hypothetical protein